MDGVDPRVMNPTVIPPLPNLIRQWKKNDDGDYIILIDRLKEGIPIVSGKIIRCPVVVKFNYRWRTKQRWLLLVDRKELGFYHTLRAAAERFDKDFVPKGKCPDCGQPNGSRFCCQDDEDLWK